ncbi:uncharacterized protein LOC124449629 isoform X2 [Xenia sp. Carnegie-2017]|uniref:uncharacterized protein LOC124449629 isoform X2 n=1 Tax=Xenia sp. Carnegie-2017 TaxID=2897299 RepID=UPI001F037C3B|nr:uncharacterized protein LOC124449629 isoform X2 [Xenia sp. Carnegie-2017]
MPYDKLLLALFQFLTNKARDTAADRLENGDVGNEGFREFIIRDLHDIKTKLDNLSKIDLCSSLNYLEEGFLLFFKCIDKVESDRKCEEASNNDESQATCTTITTRYDLSRAIQHSEDFEMAKKRFKKSREEATRALSNKNLSLEERIFAIFVKIMAQIFECPERQEIVITLCLSYMKKLHEFDGVRQMFSVSIGGGMRAMFKKSQRMENMKSVILLNHHLYQFIARINNNHDHLSTWPSIELEDGKMFNPIQDWRNEFPVESWYKNLIESSQEMEKMKTMMFELLDKMTINEHFTPILTSPVELVMDLFVIDILVAGGNRKSVEIFSWKEEKWFKIASMENNHRCASSFIYNDNLFVVGGRDCKSMETLNIKQLTLTRKTFHTELPYVFRGHQTVVCKQQILHIGGRIEELIAVLNESEGTSDLIREIKITGETTYDLKELCHMPEPRYGHGAVVVDDKVLIFGGWGKDSKVLSSVLEFDPRTLTCKEMPPLPHPLTDMATVQWRDQVVLLGGYDGKETLNSVIMYDRRTGKITVLPSMLEKRSLCCAVITGDTMVVMGGVENLWKDLKSVECFEMGSSYSWRYLPSMNESRDGAIAEVLSFGQKKKGEKFGEETKSDQRSFSAGIKNTFEEKDDQTLVSKFPGDTKTATTVSNYDDDDDDDFDDDEVKDPFFKEKFLYDDDDDDDDFDDDEEEDPFFKEKFPNDDDDDDDDFDDDEGEDPFFKEKFLNDEYDIRDDVHTKLRSLPWMRGEYGTVGPNKIIPYVHVFVTVDYKKGSSNKDVLKNEIDQKLGTGTSKYVEFRKKSYEKPKLELLSDIAVRRSNEPTIRGTLTMFCYHNDKHYALTCFHVGYNKDDIDQFPDMLHEVKNDPNGVELFLNSNKYFYTPPENSSEIPLGHRCRLYSLEKDTDIMAIEVDENVDVYCKRQGFNRPRWSSIWQELHKRVNSRVTPKPKVMKFVGENDRSGEIFMTNFGYFDEETNIDIKNAVLVKSKKHFLKNGESGVLVFFIDKNEKKQAFGYGVARWTFEEDEEENPVPDPEYPYYYVCFKLQRALSNLFGEGNFERCGCFERCANGD